MSVSRSVARFVVSITLAILVVGCSSASTADVLDASLLPDGRTLGLSVNTCNADLSVTATESASQVEVMVTVADYERGPECLDTIEVRLHAPLDDRRLIDRFDGHLMRVTPAP